MKKVRRFNGTEGSDVPGLLGDEANKRFAERFNAVEEEENLAAEQRGENILKGMRDAEAKPPIVTMDQVKKAGFSNLRDYLNDKQKLTRRGGATAMPSNAKLDVPNVSSPRSAATPMSTDPSQRSKPKYQSLQDRAEEYAMKNKAAGMGMYGTKKSEPATGTPKRSKNLTDMLGLSSNYASGGKVRSASSRADGIAIRGKTRA